MVVAEVHIVLVSIPRQEDQEEAPSTQAHRRARERPDKETPEVTANRGAGVPEVAEVVVAEQAPQAAEVLALMSAELVVLAPHQLSRDQV